MQMDEYKSKSPVTIEGFCREFYDSIVFNSVKGGLNFNESLFDTYFNSIVEADASFNLVDKNLFKQELVALRMELFALAWAHKFRSEKFTMPQSIFTRSYLEETGRPAMWDVMGEYNQAIAQAVTMDVNFKPVSEKQIVKINFLRFELFKNWAKSNLKDTSNPTEAEKQILPCFGRVANRIETNIRHNDCVMVKRLSTRLAARLNCDTNLKIEAIMNLGGIIFGLYEGAKEALKNLNLR